MVLQDIIQKIKNRQNCGLNDTRYVKNMSSRLAKSPSLLVKKYMTLIPIKKLGECNEKLNQ